MAPSQLKQLKASLRDTGVLGPQKTKKQQKSNSKDATKRLRRNAALQGIRDRFNPFEVKAPARKEKFEVATNKVAKSAVGRPGVTRGLGEERRRETLLKEMQSRNKIGGLMDRRFGENDPTMTPEEKAAERFARQAMRTSKKSSMFNLEDDSEDEMVLTHGGQAIGLGGATRDDFQEDLSGSDGGDFDEQDDRPTKRMRLGSGENEIDGETDDAAPERRKTKNEVMKEVIAKSKMYKAERQAAKADDDDLRLELDKGMGEFYEALKGHKSQVRQLPSPPQTDSEPMMDPGRAAMLAGKSREEADKEYEANVQRLKLEAKSKPSVRTKTEEEKAAEQAAKFEELERKRLRRMRGEAENSDEEDNQNPDVEAIDEDDEEQDDAEEFGLAQPAYPPRPQLDVEDEDEFVIDDIVASDSEADLASDEENESEEDIDPEDDGDDDFINGLVLPKAPQLTITLTDIEKPSKNLAYTFPCPQTHSELLEVTKNARSTDLPTIVQRIRALYHKGLKSENQEKQAKFAAVLLEHIAYLVDSDMEDLPFSVIESLIRHLHSMAKSQPEDIGLVFRDRLREISEKRPLSLTPGDLIVLTAVSTIFPTSDHFHPVTTPSMLTIARYIGQSSIQTFQDLGIGAYCCSLALQFQKLAKRVVPEVITYIANALAILSPIPIKQSAVQLDIPIRLPETSLRIKQSNAKSTPSMQFNHIRATKSSIKLSSETLLSSFLILTQQSTTLWSQKSSFVELIQPFHQVVSHLLSDSNTSHLSRDIQSLATKTLTHFTVLTSSSLKARVPLLLHSHRPLAIKQALPSFIENFNPDRHYDPDRERAESAKLRAEHKKEKKGAMRELRKDANFVAREQLREKKAKDEAYDKKFKRLVAEIQGEEGREAKEYEREKRRRKAKN